MSALIRLHGIETGQISGGDLFLCHHLLIVPELLLRAVDAWPPGLVTSLLQPSKRERCTWMPGGDDASRKPACWYTGPCLIQRSTTSSTRRPTIRSMPTAATSTR
jgi:hypothetical protein